MAWQRIVRTYYALTGLWTVAASLIWGINTLFLLDAGLSVFQAFAANAAFTAGQVLFEIPTGIVADTRGRRISFLFAVVVVIAGTVGYIVLAAVGAHFAWWLLVSVLLGLGFTFFSGAVEAWFVDALAFRGGPKDLDPFFARGAQVFGIGMLIGTVGGGVLGTFHLSAPYVARAVLLVLALLAALWWMRDEGFQTRPFVWHRVPEELQEVGRNSLRFGWRRAPVRMLMIMTLLQMGFLLWGWYAWQPYFLELLGRDLVWVAGVIAALVSTLQIAGNQIVRLLQGRIRRPTVLLYGSLGLALAMIGVGLAPSFYPAVGLFLVGMLCFGVVSPIKQAALHRLIPSKQRATIVSFDGLLGSAGGVGSQLGLARLAQSHDKGYAAGYIVGGIALLFAVPAAWRFRRIVGCIEAAEPVAEDYP